MECIKVVIGIIHRQQNILLSLRPRHVSEGELWEFPGGKVEAHEINYAALCRELDEELGIHVSLAYPWPVIYHVYETYCVELHPWLVNTFSGEPVGREGQVIRWASMECLKTMSMPDANQKVIQWMDLLLPVCNLSSEFKLNKYK